MNVNPDPCQVCGKPQSTHVYPDIVPCPRCGRAEHVAVWEAWGHPNGDLYCMACLGYLSGDIADDYWTFRVEDGATVIVPWGPEEEMT